VTTAPAAALLLGGPLAAEIRAGVKRRLEALRDRGRPAGLAVVTVGEPPSGNPYVRAKVKAAQEAGAVASVHRLPEDIAEPSLRDALRAIGDDREERHLEDVLPAKDVDGIHPANVGRWVNGLPAPRPATPLGVQELLRRHCGDLAGKRVVILGRSRIVGRPLSVLLSSREPGMNATVTLCHSETRDLPALCREAEILVVAIGHRRSIGAAHVRPGAVVIDVGIHPIANPAPGAPRYEGDVDFEAVRSIASAITPVPGGVGPLTVAMLLRNLADAAEAAEAAEGGAS
jgi:methylenetetrahydrofolate dehydrogenase (NADP+)/methenyltetrahydrofolate cyclohydrolase